MWFRVHGSPVGSGFRVQGFRVFLNFLPVGIGIHGGHQREHLMMLSVTKPKAVGFHRAAVSVMAWMDSVGRGRERASRPESGTAGPRGCYVSVGPASSTPRWEFPASPGCRSDGSCPRATRGVASSTLSDLRSPCAYPFTLARKLKDTFIPVSCWPSECTAGGPTASPAGTPATSALGDALVLGLASRKSLSCN